MRSLALAACLATAAASKSLRSSVRESDAATPSPPPVGNRYFRFTVQDLRDSTAGSVQVAEILFQKDGQLVQIPRTAVDLNGQCPDGQQAPMAVDDDYSTKWLDFLWDKGQLVVLFDDAQIFDAFTFVTADDHPERDPVSFKLDANVGDGSSEEWTLLHQETGFAPTTARKTEQKWFYLKGGHRPSDDGGSSAGGGACGGGCVFLILFFCGGFVYVVAGAAYNFKVKELRGTEVIPHVEFWKDVPFLVKDGATFIASKVRRGGSYVTV